MEQKEFMNELLVRARAAQKVFETYTQEQVDAVVRAVGKVIYDNAEMLAEEAVQESHMGNVKSKVDKQRKVTLACWAYLKDKKSVGIIREEPELGIKVVSKPVGVIGCITPSTNPTSTMAGNVMHAFKSRNAVIVAPHPSTAKCSVHGGELIRGELKKLGAPEDLLQVIAEPSIEMTQLLMSSADVIAATGGPGMLKAAYSSGKPSYGVGQGNVQCIIDQGYTDFEFVARNVVANRAYDLGVPCTGEQSLHIPAEVKDEVIAALKKEGAFFIEDEEVIDRIRDIVFPDGRNINRGVVGKTAVELGKIFGVDVPEESRILMIPIHKKGEEDVLCKEILCPIVRYYVYSDFEDTVAVAQTNLLMEGAGHTSCIYSTNEDHITYAGLNLPVGRCVVCQHGAAGAGNTPENGLNPTITLGCGSWGNNSISENLIYTHFMNTTRIAYRLNAEPYDPQELWGE